MKNKYAVALGRKGGKARALKLTQEQRSDGARKAVRARWDKRLVKELVDSPEVAPNVESNQG